MLSDTPATIAISFTPSAVVTLPAISGGNSECICRGSFFSLIFHSSFMSLTFVLFRILSLRCHAVRCGSPPSVNQSAFFCCAVGVTIEISAAPSPARPASNRRVIDATPRGRCLYQNGRRSDQEFLRSLIVSQCESTTRMEPRNHWRILLKQLGSTPLRF